jgi:hypothetical protein
MGIISSKLLDKALDKMKNSIYMESGKPVRKGLLLMPSAESVVVKVLGVLGRAESQCRRGESNPHGLKAHWILSPARLPVSPLRHG